MRLDNPIKQKIVSVQQSIHQAIVKLGGYWQPLSGLARLQEEIGEICELTLVTEAVNEPITYQDFINDSVRQQDLAAELTDVFIISTCLANQYCIALEEAYQEHQQVEVILQALSTEYGKYEREKYIHQQIGRIVLQAGQVARILNHYDGDKTKKKTETKQTLAQEIVALHVELILIAAKLEINLLEKISETVEHNLRRDKGRFALTPDPVTEESRISFLEISQACSAPFSRIWGAKKWSENHSVQENLERDSTTFRRFIKGGYSEGVEGIVILLPSPLQENSEGLERAILLWLTNRFADLLTSQTFVIRHIYHHSNHFVFITLQEKGA